MSIGEFIVEFCSENPWFDLNHETVILGKTIKDDDDPLWDNSAFRFAARPRGGYPELPKVQVPSKWWTVESPLPYSPELVSRVGQSGWNHIDKVVTYVCLEFDVASEHATTGISLNQLESIQAQLCKIPYVEVRRSTGGNGLHVRVPLVRPVPAPTRAEYQATTFEVYCRLCNQLPLIRDMVDQTALRRGVLWIWADRMNERSFQLLSCATEQLDLDGWEPVVLEKAPVAPSTRTLPDGYDVKEVLDRIGVQYTTKRYDAADNCIGYLVPCPTDHANDSASKTMVWSQNGVPCFRCFADKCKKLTWQQYIRTLSPDDPAARLNSTECAVLTIIHLAARDELFHDESGNAYVTCRYAGGPAETFLIASDQYRHVLRRRYNETTGRVASEETISLAMSELTARAIRESPQFQVHIRVASRNDKHYLDLCDELGRAIEIDKEGWRIVDVPKGVRFIRPVNLRPLPMPERGGNVELLRRYITVSDSDWPLILAWLIGAMRSNAPCAVLVMIGAAGSGKTNGLEVIVSTFHPTAAPDPKDFTVAGMPKSLDDLLVTAFNSWVVGVDNVSEISQPLSDIICCLVTGATRGARALYSNNGLSIFTVRRPVVLASTGQVINASDLADRCLIVDVPPIKVRVAEHTLWSEFKKDRPKILGALLDGFFEGLRNIDVVELDDPPRMMDFATFATAAESAFGFEPGTTVAAMKARQASIAQDSVEESPLATRLIEFAREGFSGTSSDVISKLGPSEHWSKNARKFRNQFNLVNPDLRKVGVRVESQIENGRTVWTLAVNDQASTGEHGISKSAA